MLAGEIETTNWEKRYIRKGASVVWFNFTISMLPTDVGMPPRFISVIQDMLAMMAELYISINIG